LVDLLGDGTETSRRTELTVSFCSQRYTRALDQIRVLRRDQAIEIKVDKAKLDALKQDRDRATKVSSSFPGIVSPTLAHALSIP
jgi:hypothetical protein